MNRRIHPNRPPGHHTEADAANPRSNPVATFRALLLRMGRPVVGTDKDRKVRRGPGAAGGPARRRGGSHLDAETDDAVEASASSGGGGGESDEGHAPLGEGGAGEGILKGSSFFSALEGATGADEGRDPDSISLSGPSLPLVWPVAALRGSWKRADPPPSPYAPPADPAQAGRVSAAFRRWARAASVHPYAPSPSAATPAARYQYLLFAPPLHPATAIVPALPRGIAVPSRTLAASLRSFVPSNTSASAPHRGAGYRPFMPPLLPAARIVSAAAPNRSARYNPFTPLMASAARIEPALPRSFGLENRVVGSMRPYRSPGPFMAARTEGLERRSYTPPPRPIGGIEVSLPLGLVGGDHREPPMSIDTLLAGLGSGVGSVAARGLPASSEVMLLRATLGTSEPDSAAARATGKVFIDARLAELTLTHNRSEILS